MVRHPAIRSRNCVLIAYSCPQLTKAKLLGWKTLRSHRSFIQRIDLDASDCCCLVGAVRWKWLHVCKIMREMFLQIGIAISIFNFSRAHLLFADGVFFILFYFILIRLRKYEIESIYLTFSSLPPSTDLGHGL